VARRVKSNALRDALLHPVRLEVLRRFELGGDQTIGDLAQALPSVPRPSLYRHVNTLLEAGALKVRGVRQGDRGAPERLYALSDATFTFAPKGEERTPDMLRRLYVAMVAAQTAEFEKGLLDGAFPAKYFHVRHSLVHVNDTELAELDTILRRLEELSRNPPKERTSLNLGIALFPVKRRRRR